MHGGAVAVFPARPDPETGGRYPYRRCPGGDPAPGIVADPVCNHGGPHPRRRERAHRCPAALRPRVRRTPSGTGAGRGSRPASGQRRSAARGRRCAARYSCRVTTGAHWTGSFLAAQNRASAAPEPDAAARGGAREPCSPVLHDRVSGNGIIQLVPRGHAVADQRYVRRCADSVVPEVRESGRARPHGPGPAGHLHFRQDRAAGSGFCVRLSHLL